MSESPATQLDPMQTVEAPVSPAASSRRGSEGRTRARCRGGRRRGSDAADPTDDGESQFVSLDRITGLRQTDGRDFCADIAEFLG